MNKRYLGGIYMALAASIWGGMYVVSKIVLETVQPLALVWLRYFVALVALVFVVLVTRQSWRIRWRDVPLVLAIGIIGYAVSIWAQFLGTKLSSAQLGAMITSATPAFMVVFGRVLLGERVTTRKALSVTLATVGVLMIIGVGGFSRSYQLGGVILLVAALTWALMSVWVKRVPSGYSQLVVTTYAIMVSTIVITPLAIKQLYGVSEALTHPVIWGIVFLLSTACRNTARLANPWRTSGIDLLGRSSVDTCRCTDGCEAIGINVRKGGGRRFVRLPFLRYSAWAQNEIFVNEGPGHVSQGLRPKVYVIYGCSVLTWSTEPDRATH